MKRVLIISLVAAFVMGLIGLAGAADLKVKGEWKFELAVVDNPDFTAGDVDGMSEDDFLAAQRARLYSQYVASESLKGVLGLEIGDSAWGVAGGGADLGADDKVIEVKHSYIQFVAPDTDLTFIVGVQGLALPAAVAGNPVFDKDVPAIVGSVPFGDAVSMAMFWTRLVEDGDNVGGDSPLADEIDALGLILPVAADGYTITPYFMYALLGEDVADAVGGLNGYGAADGERNAYWLGAAFTLDMFDPFVFVADAIFGSSTAGEDAAERTGYWAAMEIDYKMDIFTPALAFWYSSGDDDDATNGSEMLPIVGGTFGPTTFLTDGSSLGHVWGRDSAILTDSGVGSMGFGIFLKSITFMEGLSHDFRFAYVMGTSDKDAGAAFDEEDTVWEINFDTNYQLYENLAAIVELGYASPDFDDNSDTEEALKMAVGLKYKF